MNETYAQDCIVENIDSGKEVEAEVAYFQPRQSLTVYMNTVKVNLTYNEKQNAYVGNFAKMDFISKGPRLLGTYR